MKKIEQFGQPVAEQGVEVVGRKIDVDRGGCLDRVRLGDDERKQCHTRFTEEAGQVGGGDAQADAIQFTGGVNSLTLEAGWSMSGAVQAYSARDTLALGGSANASFDALALATIVN